MSKALDDMTRSKLEVFGLCIRRNLSSKPSQRQERLITKVSKLHTNNAIARDFIEVVVWATKIYYIR